MNILAGVLSLAAIAIVMGIVITYDRIRERHCNPYGVMAVVDERTLGDALRRVDRLDPATPAGRLATIAHLSAARIWLRHEHRFGSARRRKRLAEHLAHVEDLLQQLSQAPVTA